MKRKFWNWMEDENTLYLDGYIAQESWFGDEVTPKLFKDELISRKGDITLWINSPGGDVFAAAQIYTMLKEYSGKVTVRIDGIAASAASVIAMAGDTIEMSPPSLMMIHNPMTIAFGEASDFEGAIEMLNEVKESIINAYELKSGMSRVKISRMMDDETWFNAKKAVELGFADKVMYQKEKVENQEGGDPPLLMDGYMFDKRTVALNLASKLEKVKPEKKSPAIQAEKQLDVAGLLNAVREIVAEELKGKVDVESLHKRLDLLNKNTKIWR